MEKKSAKSVRNSDILADLKNKERKDSKLKKNINFAIQICNNNAVDILIR